MDADTLRAPRERWWWPAIELLVAAALVVGANI
jgi:hypothetical protein